MPAYKPMRERILSRIEITAQGCWQWLGAKYADGYGNTGKGSVHRASYLEFKGPIPSGMELDHLCKNRACCNPDHLEPVTHAENVRRGANAQKTHCKNGHPLSGGNLVRGTQQRQCRTCANAAAARYQQRKRARNWK